MVLENGITLNRETNFDVVNILYKSLYFDLRKYNLDKDYKEQFTSRNENKHSTQGSILELMLLKYRYIC